MECGNLALHAGEPEESVHGRRRGLERTIGAEDRTLVFMQQTHSATVTEVLPGNTSGAQAADAVMSIGGRTPLAVMVADCLPVLIAGQTAGGWATAAVHAGRVGLFGGILANAVDQLRAAGAQHLQAWIGPSICGKCYEVPRSMRDEGAAVLSRSAATTRAGTPSLDLPAGAREQLERLEVEAEATGICTLEDPRVYSYRGGANRDRFAGVIWTDQVDDA